MSEARPNIRAFLALEMNRLAAAAELRRGGLARRGRSGGSRRGLTEPQGRGRPPLLHSSIPRPQYVRTST